MTGRSDADYCPGCGGRITDHGGEGRELPNGQRWCHADHADRMEMLLDLLLRSDNEQVLDACHTYREVADDLGVIEGLRCALQEANLLDVEGGPDDEIRLKGD